MFVMQINVDFIIIQKAGTSLKAITEHNYAQDVNVHNDYLQLAISNLL